MPAYGRTPPYSGIIQPGGLPQFGDLLNRARETHDNYEISMREKDPYYDSHKPINMLPMHMSNPNMAAWFQSLADQGVDKMADSSVGAAKGMWSGPAPFQPTFNPYDTGERQANDWRYNTSVAFKGGKPVGLNVAERNPSNQIGSPLGGLRALLPPQR